MAGRGKSRLIPDKRIRDHRDLVRDGLVRRVEAVVRQEQVGARQDTPLIDVARDRDVGSLQLLALAICDLRPAKADDYPNPALTCGPRRDRLQRRQRLGRARHPDGRPERHVDLELPLGVRAKPSSRSPFLFGRRRVATQVGGQRAVEGDGLEDVPVVVGQEPRRLAVQVEVRAQARDVGERRDVGQAERLLQPVDSATALIRDVHSWVLAKDLQKPARHDVVAGADVDIRDAQHARDHAADHRKGVV